MNGNVIANVTDTEQRTNLPCHWSVERELIGILLLHVRESIIKPLANDLTITRVRLLLDCKRQSVDASINKG